VPLESRLGAGSRLRDDDVARLDRQCAGIVGSFDAGDISSRITGLLTDEYGFHMSWIGAPATDGALITHTSGNRTERFPGTLLRNGRGLGGKVFASGRPAWVDDYFGSVQITHDYDEFVAAEQVQRMVAAPLIAEGRNFGVLLCGHRDPGSCGDRTVALVEAVAERCARALSIAERAHSVAALAVYEDRRQTALRLHERLGAMLLGIEADVRALRESASGRLRDERIQTLERLAGDATALLGEWRHAGGGPRDSARRSGVPVAYGSLHAAPQLNRAREPGGAIARRERDVLRRVAIGETNLEIAGAMSLSYNTVKTYLRNAMAKLGARNRVEAIARAREMGLL
jgi:DNA-binding CsgD family transcriptional regulator